MVIKIPNQLKEESFRFILIKKRDKLPIEKWQDSNYVFNDEKLIKHIENEGNYGLICGNGLIVIDADTEKLDKITQDNLPKTFVVKTAKGKHYYYYCIGYHQKRVLCNDKEHLGEIQSNGSYVVSPNSIHSTGVVYEIINDIQIARVSPTLIDEIFRKYYSTKRVDKKVILEGATSGVRNDSMFRLACSFREKGLGLNEVFVTLKTINKKNSPPLFEEELKTIVESAFRYKKNDDIKIETKSENEKKTEKKEKVIHTSFIETDNLLIEQVYDGNSKFCIYDKKTENISYATEIIINNLKHKPIEGEEVTKGAIGLPNKAEEYGSDEDLNEEIKTFIIKYLDLPEDYLQFAIWNIKRSWVFEKFHTLNYLRALGDTGEGKTRFLDTLGYIHYKPIATSGATTPAPIFRLIDKWRGTLIIDEADLSHSDESQDIIKIINQGYEFGKHIIRCDQNDASKVNFFDPFCPKLLATRKTFQDKAVESRCITQIMRGTSRTDIPLNLNGEFFDTVRMLRNKLLMWRFHNYEKIVPNIEKIDLGDLEPRVIQVVSSLIPLFSNNKEELESFKVFIKKHQENLIDERQDSFEGQVVEGIAQLVNSGNDFIAIKDIIEVSTITDRRGNPVKTRTISKVLKGLGFENSKLRKVEGVVKRCISLEENHIKKLLKRFGFELTESGNAMLKKGNTMGEKGNAKGNRVTPVTLHGVTPQFLLNKKNPMPVAENPTLNMEKRGLTPRGVTSVTNVTNVAEDEAEIEEINEGAEKGKVPKTDQKNEPKNEQKWNTKTAIINALKMAGNEGMKDLELCEVLNKENDDEVYKAIDFLKGRGDITEPVPGLLKIND